MSFTSRSAPGSKAGTANRDGVKVGDVFVASWGYDQTNVDAYVVVRVTKAMVAIKKCPLKPVGEGHRTKLIPDPSSPIDFTEARYCWEGTPNEDGEIMKRTRVSSYDGTPSIKITDYAWGYLWDGERSYFDTLAAGYPGH
jgi:hypothetical protein